MWREHVVPRLTDLSLRSHEIGELRGRALAGLHGRVLEIGFGSGLNVRWYPNEVTSVSAVEPSDVGWRLSERRRARTTLPIERSGLDGERIDEPDASYDAAVSTFTLCTIPDAVAAVREVRRVLRPGASFHVLEHGLAAEPDVVRRQHRWEPVQKRLAGGCHLTRDPVAMLESAGFTVEDSEAGYFDAPRFAHPWVYVHRVRARA